MWFSGSFGVNDYSRLIKKWSVYFFFQESQVTKGRTSCSHPLLPSMEFVKWVGWRSETNVLQVWPPGLQEIIYPVLVSQSRVRATVTSRHQGLLALKVSLGWWGWCFESVILSSCAFCDVCVWKDKKISATTACSENPHSAQLVLFYSHA